jgi:hypothetical protein|tara:strand:+ start:1355 stop:2374 length:1020 start_codon:yes stop_codon:yes gene_type:complete
MAQTYGFEIESFGLTPAQLKNAIESVEGQVYQAPNNPWGSGSNVVNQRIYSYGESKRLPLRIGETGHLWVAAQDSTIRNTAGRGISHEIISPVLEGQEGLATLRKVMRALKNAGAQVNKSCGLHVTMGVENVSMRYRRMGAWKKMSCLMNLAEAYHYFQAGFTSLNPESRNPYSRQSDVYNGAIRMGWANQFGKNDKHTAKAAAHGRKNAISAMLQLGRGVLNYGHIWNKGVIEFRQHSGSLNGTKITNWALLCHKLLSWALNPEHPNHGADVREYPPNLDGLINMTAVGSMLRDALEMRHSELFVARVRAGLPSIEATPEAFTTYRDYQYSTVGQEVF